MVACTLYEPAPSAAEAATFGLTVEEASGQCSVWPDNLKAVNIFMAAATQWRVGPNGATGLDYSVLPVLFRIDQVPRSEWPELLDQIRVLESSALSTIHEGH